MAIVAFTLRILLIFSFHPRNPYYAHFSSRTATICRLKLSAEVSLQYVGETLRTTSI